MSVRVIQEVKDIDMVEPLTEFLLHEPRKDGSIKKRRLCSILRNAENVHTLIVKDKSERVTLNHQKLKRRDQVELVEGDRVGVTDGLFYMFSIVKKEASTYPEPEQTPTLQCTLCTSGFKLEGVTNTCTACLIKYGKKIKAEGFIPGENLTAGPTEMDVGEYFKSIALQVLHSSSLTQ